MASVVGSEACASARFVAEELVEGLRLSKSVPLETDQAAVGGRPEWSDVQVVYGDEYAPIGFLIRLDYRGAWTDRARYYVFAKSLQEAARLTVMSEEQLKAAVRAR